MIDIRHIRAFVAVAEELNFHRAAERLSTVQPALSRLIQNLEENMQVHLIERTTRHVQLTEAGKDFLLESRGILNQLLGAVRSARDTARGTKGTLTLAYMDFAVHRLLPNLLAVHNVAEPDIRIQLTYMSTARQRLALIEGKIDLGILIGTMTGPQVESMLLSEEPIFVVMGINHRLAKKRSVAFKDFLDEPLLLGSDSEWSAFRDFIFALYAEHGASPKIRYEASSAAALLGMAAKGLGITFYAGLPTVYQGPDLVFRKLSGPKKLPISLVWRKGPKLPLIRRFLKGP